MRPKNSAKDRVLASKGTILAILFAVTGFLGLPLLWMSPAFSRMEKIVWSIINVVYTSVMIAACAAICWWSYNRIIGN
ncbi:MAG: hypothetical protein ACOVLE_12010 [Pirellula staleyi]